MLKCYKIALFIALASMGLWPLTTVDTPFSVVPASQREQLSKRLREYVEDNRSHDWGKLYDFISNTGKGGVDRETFIARMNEAHQPDFSSAPDLLDFQPVRTIGRDPGQWDIYGCGKAVREHRTYRGIAVVRAVFQNDWYFTGWSFTEFPNEPCKHLDANWEPDGEMAWDQPMEELRGIANAAPPTPKSPK